jgi:hypothetical protein
MSQHTPDGSPRTRVFSHLRANAIAYVALFAALAGTGYAANKIGPRGLKKNAVTKPKIAPNAVDGSKVGNGTLAGADLGANSIGGAQINEAGLSGVNAAQLAGVDPAAFGSGVVMGKIVALDMTTNAQYAFPAGIGGVIQNVPAERTFVTVPNQVVSDFVVHDEDLMAAPTDDLTITLEWQGNTVATCAITPTQAPRCSDSTDGIIGDAGENSLIIEVDAENASSSDGHDLVFAYRLTPAP